jgi:16S rRNA (guanine527-N7)-methyltransferase
MEIIEKYFPGITSLQRKQFEQLFMLYSYWNTRINVISRKDINNLYERHVLHSLAIAKIIQFREGTDLMDVGTGGGFPGIPLAIFFPGSKFILIDSVGKKIKVVNAIINSLGLANATAEQIRVENIRREFDFIISRAVTNLQKFYKLVKKNIRSAGYNDLPNGILYLKGEEMTEEVRNHKSNTRVYHLSEYFDEEFFTTKKIVYVSDMINS